MAASAAANVPPSTTTASGGVTGGAAEAIAPEEPAAPPAPVLSVTIEEGAGRALHATPSTKRLAVTDRRVMTRQGLGQARRVGKGSDEIRPFFPGTALPNGGWSTPFL